MDNEQIANNILCFLRNATADMSNEQAELFITGYMYGLATGNKELFDMVETVAKWDLMMGE